MSEFNLEEFKAGRPAITRDGRIARFVGIDTNANLGFQLITKLRDARFCYHLDGIYDVNKEETDLDLVAMADVPQCPPVSDPLLRPFFNQAEPPAEWGHPTTSEDRLAEAVQAKLNEPVRFTVSRPYYLQDNELDLLSVLAEIMDEFEDTVSDDERRRVVAWFNSKYGG